MGEITSPKPVKLIVAMLSARADGLGAAADRLRQTYGPTDATSEIMPFDFTHYYDEQMGAGLRRQFLTFERLISPAELVAIKRATNRMEADLAAAQPAGAGGPARPVNLDPGYVAESKLVLASTKDFAHRVYLADGIYAEVTLRYVRGRWVSAEYTFPDYASGGYDGFLSRAREMLRRQLQRKEQPR